MWWKAEIFWLEIAKQTSDLLLNALDLKNDLKVGETKLGCCCLQTNQGYPT